MLHRIEPLIRKLAWVPGLYWMNAWADSMLQKGADVQQITGDYQAQARSIKGVADPLGSGAEAGDAAAAATSAGAPGATVAATDTQGGSGPAASPQYRSQRIASRGSCMMFVFLFILVGVVWALFFFDPRNIPWRHSMSWWRIAAQVVLVFTIPIVLNRIIQMWLEGVEAKYPDIQYAWDYGLRSLQASGIAIDSVPLFLMIGSESDRQEMAIQHAAHLEHRVAGVPGGSAALHWYVTHQAIYLYATDVGWTSTVATPSEAEVDVAADQLIGAPSDVISNKLPSNEGSVDSSTARIGPTRTLASPESSKALNRLRYLCRRIRNIRTPLCPLNGVVVMLPHRMLSGTEEALGELEKAVKSDLETIQTETQISVPITTVVTGMEEEPGFRELVRRVGRDRSIGQRFGKKFDVSTVCNEDELRAFNAHVIGSFEDWIYTLFRETTALSKPGNTNLYGLLCNVRCSLKSRLEQFFVRVFGKSGVSHLFSGCYFAATGDTPDRQAFVRGVFDKLADEQELLEWASMATREDRRILWLSRLGTFCAVFGFTAVIFFLGQRWEYW
jgi:hypothetical protein